MIIPGLGGKERTRLVDIGILKVKQLTVQTDVELKEMLSPMNRILLAMLGGKRNALNHE